MHRFVVFCIMQHQLQRMKPLHFFPKESFSGAATAAWKKSNKVNEGNIFDYDFADTAKGSGRIYCVC